MAADAFPLHRSKLPPPAARTIRFAPLPEPRSSPTIPTDAPGLLVSDPPLSDDASTASTSTSSTPPRKSAPYPVESYPTSGLTPLQTDPEHAAHNPPAPKSKTRTLFRTFFRKSGRPSPLSPPSSIDLAPTPSIDNYSRRFNLTAEEILTLGTINLFRSVSRNSRCSTDNYLSGEWDLSRWSTVNSAQSAPGIGSPLARSQSTRSGGKNLITRPASSGGTPATSKIKPFKGMKMLNGRVYGAPKRNSNPFANVRDEADPAFVEWGYGGMGSVSGRHAAGMGGTRWERLHNGQGSDDPLDDGSGMGWVKKRREAREREQREKDGKTRGHPESANGNVASTPNTKSESNASTTASNTEANTSSSASHPPLSPNLTRPSSAASTSTPHSTSMKSSEREHILHAVTIPANYQRHNHHRSTSKTGAISSDANDETKTNSPSGRQVTGTQSESSEESDSEESNDEDDEDSDTGEFGQSKRKTALGASVEKYMRHKDAEPDPATIPVVVE